MEFHIPKSSDSQGFQDSFHFDAQDLADIPCPDDIYPDTEGSPQEEDNELLLPPGTTREDFPDLPLPPGTSEEDLPIPLPPKQKPVSISSNFFPSDQQNKTDESTLNVLQCESERFNIFSLNEDSEQKPYLKSDEFQEEIPNKQMELLDDSKYSPSKVDSDNENQDFITIKPKVLGKEQAKKRLMAFSLTKQTNTSVKKPSKAITPAKSKEKSLNANKGSNVQDQFRATISAIEEEKKKMYQNMPRHLLLEMSELTKSSHSTMSSSMQVLEKLKNKDRDSKSRDTSNKDSSNTNKTTEGKSKRSYRKSRSRSRSKKSRRSTSKGRSQSRNKRDRSINRGSYSRSRRSREKNYKTDNKESQSLTKREFEDWKSFKAASVVVEGESETTKNRSDDSKFRRDDHRRSRSPRNRSEIKPLFSYLTKTKNPMSSFQAKPAEPGNPGPIFLAKTIKYTRAKPILCWAENPSRATEFYMSKQMLLENCDETTASILVAIMENKSTVSSQEDDTSETLSTKSRPWFSRDCYFLSSEIKKPDVKVNEFLPLVKDFTEFSTELPQAEEKIETVNGKEELNSKKVFLERKISLVNDSYLSEEEDQMKESAAGGIKMRLNIDLNRLKVRSKWDSDCEGENSEKDLKKKEMAITATQGSTPQAKDKLIDDFDVAPREETPDESSEKKRSLDLPSSKVPEVESPSLNASDVNTGILASEYEEFLKMVSVDARDDYINQKEKTVSDSKPKTESKGKKQDKSDDQNKRSPKLGITDWDQESDREDKSIGKKLQFTTTGTHDEFLILGKNEATDVSLEKSKKKPIKKKNEKEKTKKKKLLKKSSKTKKKKIEDSVSEEDSSSESYDSDSDSDSDDSDSSKKRKKKKILKTKRKFKKDSSSENNSESSNESKSKKKKTLKKKGKRKKSSSSSSSSSDDDDKEVQTVLLKQLDFKKQLMMKKIDDIGTMSNRTTRKKEKENRGKKKEKGSPEESDSDKYIKSGKKKKSEEKFEKDKKKSKLSKKGKLIEKSKKIKRKKSSSESDSDSESSDESTRKKKMRKSGKRNRYTTESSETDEKSKLKSKSLTKISRKTKKSVRDSSSSESDDSDGSLRDKKKTKKGEKVKGNDERFRDSSFKEDLLLDEPDIKSEKRSAWEGKKLWKKPEGKNKKSKEDDDWEESSSVEKLEQEPKTRESSWDEEETKAFENSMSKFEKRNTSAITEKEVAPNSTDTSEANNQLSSEALKTSLSNFSFNENSFCSFGQELSRDFFLAERSYSNSGIVNDGDSFNTTSIDPRPFQSVSKDSELKKPAESELYSPGYSDSEPEVSKSDKANSNSNAESGDRDALYDPLNCDSENSADNAMEVSNIPLPHVSDEIPTENSENVGPPSSTSEGSVLKDIPRNETDISTNKFLSGTPPGKYSFAPSDFTPLAPSHSIITEEKTTPTKKQLMSVKGQQKLVSKAASVFQDESDEENIEPLDGKERSSENREVSLKEKSTEEGKSKNSEKSYKVEKDSKKRRKETPEKSWERSDERESKRRRSRSRERSSKKSSSPRRRKSRTPEVTKERREIRSDSFEIEPLKSSIDSNELTGMVQPIPVLTGLETSSSEGFWSRSRVSSCEFPHTTDNLIDHAESFDIYPPEESNFRSEHYDKDYSDHDKPVEKSRDQKSKKERRKSRSRSFSPRKKIRSKSPERRKSPRSRSPRRKSVSPKRRDKSPFSPRKRSPKRKSPSRKYKNSRSGDKRRKSPSRSPRSRRGSASWRSRSSSPREESSPKRRDESPRRKDSSSSPRNRYATKKDIRYPSTYSEGLQNRIPVIGTSSEDIELSPSAMRSYETPMGFGRHMPDSSVTEPEMYGSFFEGDYTNEFGVSSYPEDVGVNNLITVKNHDIEEGNSTERLSLDQRIEMELGVQMSGSQAQSDQYQMPNQVCSQFQEMNSSHFTNSYNCENTSVSNDNFYQNQNVQMNADFNGQYFNGHQQQPANYGSFQPYLNSQPSQNSVLQVGNIVEVVPTTQHPSHPLPSQIMQVGNVLQVVTSPKASQVPSHSYGPPETSPLVKAPKATAVVAPSSIVPPTNVETILNPLIKAIQLEREKRKKEKEKRKAEREARRKARQLRREAKLMSVNEKLKKSVQDEGLMLGQEVEDEELLDGLDVPSPPIPVEIITVSSVGTLPPAGKGILITAGFMPKPPSEKKEVKFADGVCPGEGTSTSGGEDIASPPPKPKLPKEKRFKKKKTKVKKKVKVQIIRQIIQEDDDEDDLSPPPPPPGDPPLVFFAKFPFAGDAQFPVYQTQTTTTTLTTIQYPTQTFE